MSRRDPSLTIPTLPSLSRGTGSPRFALQRSPPLQDDRPFELRAPGLLVDGGHMRGVDAVRGKTSSLARGLGIEGAIAERSAVSPLGLERQLNVGGVAVIEHVVVSPAGPIVFFEWRVSDDVGVNIRWRVPVPGARWHASDSGLVVAADAARALYLLSRPAMDLPIRAHGATGPVEHEEDGADHDLVVAARFDLRAGDRVVIAMAEVVTDADEARVLRVMGRPHVVVPARRATALRTLRSTLALDVPDDPIAEALDWAKLTLAAETFDGGEMQGGIVSERWLRIGLAGLAVGEASPARSVIRGAAGVGDSAERAAAETPSDAARWLLLVARYLAWTGDLSLMKEQWARVVRCVDRLAGQVAAAAEELDPALRRRALVELAVAAEEVGDEALAARARNAVGEGEGVPDLCWAGSAAAEKSDPALESAALVEVVVQEVLGVEPDAARRRLVLRPRLPETWSRCVVRGLTMGEAVVEIEYRADGGAYVWRVRQRRGGAPITLIFEPELPGGRITAARVDGAAAQLDAVASDGRLKVPVQLVLDHERRVEVEIEGPDD